MSSILIDLVIQLLSGAAGGNVLGSLLNKYSLGKTGNSVAGAIGGVGLGQLLPMLTGLGGTLAASGIDVGSIVSSIAGGGVGGAVLTLLVGLITQGGKR